MVHAQFREFRALPIVDHLKIICVKPIPGHALQNFEKKVLTITSLAIGIEENRQS